MGSNTKKVIVILLRCLLAGVFIYAGVIKAIDPAQFAADVDHFRLLPYAMSCAVGVYLPWLEIFAGVALLFSKWRAGAALLLAAMLVVFLIALGSAWARGLDITCGCFGHALNKSNYPLSILLDMALLAVLFVTARWRE
ncbi:MAG: MauE/DoxX family redox-associated membrane protein [Verrucomicrobiota bacterium]